MELGTATKRLLHSLNWHFKVLLYQHEQHSKNYFQVVTTGTDAFKVCQLVTVSHSDINICSWFTYSL